jgi:uncharacterized protein
VETNKNNRYKRLSLINLGTLKNITSAKKYLQRAIIARENMGSEMNIILKGEVGVFYNYRKHGEKKISVLEPGDFFGESALFLDKGSPYTTIALTDVIVLPINRNIAASFIRGEPETSYELMKAMCTKLDAISSAYEKLNGAPWLESEPQPQAASAAQTLVEPSPAFTAPAGAVPASAPIPAAVAQDNPSGVDFSLFPEGHMSFQLQLNSLDRNYLMERGYACPICKKEFLALAVRTSKLIEESTDSDMRHRYRGIEPLYYDVVTCPDCLYSAMTEAFSKPDTIKSGLSELKAIKSTCNFSFSLQMDSDSVFAGYYLALYCAPKCFADHHLATAKLFLKLSRIYQDCGNQQMVESSAKQALDSYLYVYLNEQSGPTQDQQLCIIIGELYLKLNDTKNARDYFFKAKTNRNGVPLLKSQAENRLLHIRETEGQS